MKSLTLYARKVTQGDKTIYETAIAAGNLTDKAYFAPDAWNVETAEGYQREQNPNHIRRITNYLSSVNNNVMPQSIVINYRGPVDVTDLGNDFVKIVTEAQIGYVTDGQHRISAAEKAIEEGTDLVDYEFPVVLMNFSEKEEMIHFRNLNFTANRPAKSLGQAITNQLIEKHGLKSTTWAEVANSRAVGLTMRLGMDVESPWYGKIALGGIRKRNFHTTVQSSFVSSIEPMFITGRFANSGENKEFVYGVFLDFWLAVIATWPETVINPGNFALQRELGIFSMNRLLGRILADREFIPTKENFERVLESISVNMNVNSAAWNISTGKLMVMRRGYTTFKGISVVTDYLWSGAQSTK